MKEKEDYYKSLRTSLDETTVFPSEYLYKFIIPNDDEKLKKIENIFNYGGAIITTKPSKTGKYKSISIRMIMKDSEAIITKYKEIGKIKGVISL